MLNVVQMLGLEKSVTLERLQVRFATKGGTVTRDLEISNLNRIRCCSPIYATAVVTNRARCRINVGIQPRGPIIVFPSRVRAWFRHLGAIRRIKSIRRNLQLLPQAGNFHVRLHAPRCGFSRKIVALLQEQKV